MNQYIITKEHIHEILNILETEQYEKVHAVLRKLHPYQSERDTVLDELRIKYVEFLDHPCPGLADKYEHCCDSEWCGLCTLDEVLEELRMQAGEP
jgi:hypothetical protein